MASSTHVSNTTNIAALRFDASKAASEQGQVETCRDRLAAGCHIVCNDGMYICVDLA